MNQKLIHSLIICKYISESEDYPQYIKDFYKNMYELGLYSASCERKL